MPFENSSNDFDNSHLLLLISQIAILLIRCADPSDRAV
jgi:hypothetical protein